MDDNTMWVLTTEEAIYYTQLKDMIKHACKYDLFIKSFIEILNKLVDSLYNRNTKESIN